MRLPFLFKNKEPKLEKKSYVSGFSTGNIYGCYQTNRLTPNECIAYYTNVPPLSTAVDLITDESAAVDLVLTTKQGDQEVNTTDAPILDILQNPNGEQTQEDFLKAIGNFILITGECFIIATGNIEREPAELFVVSPSLVSSDQARGDGMIKKFQVSQMDGRLINFFRDPRTDRFFNKDETAELWQIKSYNPAMNGRGLSRLNSLQLELDIYTRTSQHNLSVLDKNMKPGGIIGADDTITQDQYDTLASQISQFYSGSENAGNVLMLENGLSFQELSLTAKDMDFAKLREDVSKSIYLRFKIPLALVATETMTFSNAADASLSFYDRSVMPLVNLINRELTLFLGERYGLNDNQFLSVDITTIQALRTRTFNEVKALQEIGVNTVNEIRSQLGYEELQDGGQFVYAPSNLLPIGEDAHTEDNLQAPEPATEREPIGSDEEDKALERDRLIKLLQDQLDIKGNRVFTDEEITEIADSEGF